MERIDIAIVGKHKTGKSTLAVLIASALQKAGIACVLQDKDHSPEDTAKCFNQLNDRVSKTLTGKAAVLIRFVNAPLYAETEVSVVTPETMKKLLWGKPPSASASAKKAKKQLTPLSDKVI